MENKKIFLYTRDSKGKIRVSENTLEYAIELDQPFFKEEYVINRRTGIIDGKLVDQPKKTVSEGKAKRTIEEQALLEFNSLLKKQIDKGYVEIKASDPFNFDTIDYLLPALTTDAQGNRKPMLAQDPKASANRKDASFFNKKEWFISPKLDGVRCKGILRGGKLKYYSRTGKEYTGSTTNFKPQFLIDFLKKHDCEVDGEIYRHGLPLNEISGHARKEEYTPSRHDQLHYYIFDLPKEGLTAEERFKLLHELAYECAENEPHLIKVVCHKRVNSYEEIIKYHDTCVEEGYEGAMVQTVDSLYEFGKRSRSLWKIKLFQDEEFEIIGHKEGLRGAEDMCFVLRTLDGKEFEAKPVGSKEIKDQYVLDMPNLIGKFGTVKFFEYSPYGVPLLPTFKCVREE